MNRLREQVERLRERFYTADEFPYRPAEQFSEELLAPLRAAAAAGDAAWDSHARGLTARQLECLLRQTPGITDPAVVALVARTLVRRYAARLVKLAFSLYQHFYDDPAVDEIYQALARQGGTPFWTLKDGIPLDVKELDVFFKSYHLRVDSRLAFRLRHLYFVAADREDFARNARQLAYHVRHSEPEGLTPVLLRYFAEVPITDFTEKVNLEILRQLGEPSASLAWSPYPAEHRNKFAQWVFLHRLKVHSLDFPRKYEVLSKYYDRVIACYELADVATLVMDFGDIVVADLNDRPYSYFYKRADFDREMAAWTNEEIPPAFLKTERGQVTARDHIIEFKEGACLQLRYQGVDFLYIEELLDIKMGLEPDFRRTNQPSRKEKYQARS